jgi:hypothetical protein
VIHSIDEFFIEHQGIRAAIVSEEVPLHDARCDANPPAQCYSLWCNSRTEQRKMPTTSAAFHATFELVNGKPATIAEFRTELSKYNRTSVLSLCPYLNFMFEWLQFQKDSNYYARLVASSFPPLWAGQFLMMGRPPFHRRQCLFVAKEALLHCTEAGIDPRKESHLGDFGRVLLMASLLNS